MILKNHKNTIKEYFFTNPTKKLRVREIERELDIPLPSVIRYVKESVSENILKREQIGTVVFYTANRSEKEYLIEKKLSNIRQIYSSGLIEYLINELSNPVIILFGSYARGEDTENSDIDLFIQTKSKSSIDLKKYEKNLNRNIQLFTFNSIKEIQNKELANNIINGIIFNGFIEVL
ncbi:MAG: nucleotidyltransferase domain-containing protein [archaeon]